MSRVSFICNLTVAATPRAHVWEHTVGSDHAPVALRADWQSQLRCCHDEPYAAAFVTKSIMEANGLVEGYSFWTFSDIFAENYFPSVPFHGGFGLLNLHGIPKPTYRAFELLHTIGDELLLVDGAHETVDAWVGRKGHKLTVLLTNHALPRHSIKTERVQIKLSNAPRPAHAYVERIDETHANPKRMWHELGAPEYLSAVEMERLQEAARVWKKPHPYEYVNESLYMGSTLPPPAVAASTVEFTPELEKVGGVRA
jgi:xylan 1,4-beta-xylosidase